MKMLVPELSEPRSRFCRWYRPSLGVSGKSQADKNVLDTGPITAVQAVEHYEIPRYGMLIAGVR